MAERYDYREAVNDDLVDFIKYGYIDRLDEFDDLVDFRTTLEDDAFVSDMVTGNASGSYYCNAWKAEEALAHNWDLIAEVSADFGIDEPTFDKGPEYWDVSIRCWMVGQVLDEAIEECGIDENSFTEEEDEE